jgi:hypothetical protein
MQKAPFFHGRLDIKNSSSPIKDQQDYMEALKAES